MDPGDKHRDDNVVHGSGNRATARATAWDAWLRHGGRGSVERSPRGPDARRAADRQHQLGDGPDQGVEAVGALAVAKAVGGEIAHLPFQLRELADVSDAALAIER